ncbi:hypothetical protein NPIL_569231 [Nephila pilipes]|uniref:Uncharacterized protein n=1 Tax=Nephila pilipes TaxID=299642 RepID=A0A8X6QQ65_NEPPI|nr:hypothetical protein NPIL_569231 [Nephila pilipes]
MLWLWNSWSHQFQMSPKQSSNAGREYSIIYSNPQKCLQFRHEISTIKCHFKIHLQHSGSVLVGKHKTFNIKNLNDIEAMLLCNSNDDEDIILDESDADEEERISEDDDSESE